MHLFEQVGGKHIDRLFKFIFIGILLINSCNIYQEEDPELATYEEGSIRQKEAIEHYLASTIYKPNQYLDKENLESIISLKALEKIAVLEAKERGIEQDSTFQQAVFNGDNRIFYFGYLRQEIIHHVITDSLIKKFYEEYSPQYRMSYIVRPVLLNSSRAFRESQKDTIEYVYELLESGRDFAELAKKYSQDISTQKKGGDLGFVIKESMGDEAIRAAMDSLAEFSYSKPIKGYEAYYILFKGEKRIVPSPPLEEVYEKIWQTLYRTRRHDIREAIEKRFLSLVSKYHYKINESVIENLIKKAGGNKLTSDLDYLNFDNLNETDQAAVIAQYNKGSIYVKELFADPKKAPAVKKDLRERLDDVSQEHLFALHAREIGIPEIPEIKQQLEDLHNKYLMSFLYQQEVKEKAEARLDSLRQAESQTVKPEDLRSFLQKKRFEFENSLKSNFEEQMKKKYNFTYISKNFDSAIKKARSLKEEQNQKRETSKENSSQ